MLATGQLTIGRVFRLLPKVLGQESISLWVLFSGIGGALNLLGVMLHGLTVPLSRLRGVRGQLRGRRVLLCADDCDGMPHIQAAREAEVDLVAENVETGSVAVLDTLNGAHADASQFGKLLLRPGVLQT